jgi:hypothetical protein
MEKLEKMKSQYVDHLIYMSHSDKCDHFDNINVQKRNKKCAVYLKTLLKYCAIEHSVLPQKIKYGHLPEKHTKL